MVDTTENGDDNDEKNPVEDEPPEIPPKRQCQRRRSKSRRGKNSNTGTEDNGTPENAENQEDPIERTSEQDDREDGQIYLTIK